LTSLRDIPVSFIWPDQLWLALLLPVLVVVYLFLLRRRKKAAVRFASVSLIKQAIGKSVRWRRHVPPALLLLALGLIVVAGARPAAVLTLPTHQQIVMLVMDVSASMRATDVMPDRITASQTAAKVFVQELPRNTRIGVVAYGGSAQLVQPPTPSRDDVLAAIDRVQLQRGTAIGSGILVGLASLFPDADPSQLNGLRTSPRDPRPARPSSSPAMPPGSYESAVMVLLTDGENNAGPDPLDAAQVAADRGLRIFTVGFGSKDGTTIGFEGWSVRVQLDEDTLKRVANLTMGQYFHAATGADLHKVYEVLRSRLVFERKETEITALFAYLAGLVAIAASALSLWWFGRIA